MCDALTPLHCLPRALICAITWQGLTVHDENAHPREDALGPLSTARGSLKERVLDWAHGVRANMRAGHSAFLSMRENAATGVQVALARLIFDQTHYSVLSTVPC